MVSDLIHGILVNFKGVIMIDAVDLMNFKLDFAINSVIINFVIFAILPITIIDIAIIVAVIIVVSYFTIIDFIIAIIVYFVIVIVGSLNLLHL